MHRVVQLLGLPILVGRLALRKNRPLPRALPADQVHFLVVCNPQSGFIGEIPRLYDRYVLPVMPVRGIDDLERPCVLAMAPGGGITGIPETLHLPEHVVELVHGLRR